MNDRISWPRRHPVVAFGFLPAVIVCLVATTAVLTDLWRDRRTTTITGTAPPSITSDDLSVVARTRVFFGHQSVGENLLDAVPSLFAEHGMSAPPIELDEAEPGPEGGFIAHRFIGENERPMLKVDDFDKAMRNGMGDNVDVAMMKLCFLDIQSGTDVDALFVHYRDSMAALQRDFPDVELVHLTIPLTTELGMLSKLKTRLGGSDRYAQVENVARERYNELIRAEYAGDHLFDLAAVESTAPDGTRISRQYNGQEYFALNQHYASDLGHLNEFGAGVAAAALLRTVARVSGK